MKEGWWIVLLAFGMMGCGVGTTQPSAQGKEGKKEEPKSTVVDLDGLQSRVPAEWQEEEPSNAMRMAQFRLPKVKGDDKDAEVVIFKGISGSPKSNIERWKTFFVPPEGKTTDDISKVSDFKIGEVQVLYLEIQGTYKYKERPFDPQAKEELLPNYRMLAVPFEGSKNPYHLRVVGPAATVDHYKQGFDDWLRNFK